MLGSADNGGSSRYLTGRDVRQGCQSYRRETFQNDALFHTFIKNELLSKGGNWVSK